MIAGSEEASSRDSATRGVSLEDRVRVRWVESERGKKGGARASTSTRGGSLAGRKTAPSKTIERNDASWIATGGVDVTEIEAARAREEGRAVARGENNRRAAFADGCEQPVETDALLAVKWKQLFVAYAVTETKIFRDERTEIAVPAGNGPSERSYNFRVDFDRDRAFLASRAR